MVLRVRPYNVAIRPILAMAKRPRFGNAASSSISSVLPITAKIWPNAENFLYLLSAAIVARFITGGVRVAVDATDKNPNKTKIERANSTWERLFIEVFGTLGNVITLHLGQDIAAWFLEKRQKLDPQLLLKQLKGQVSPHHAQALKNAMEESFGLSPKGIISRVLYGYKDHKANIDSFEKVLKMPELMPALESSLHTFAKRLNHSASLALLAGIGLSAFFGGVIVQLVNDYAFSKIEPYLNSLIGLRDNRLFKSGTPVQAMTPDLPLAQRTFRS